MKRDYHYIDRYLDELLPDIYPQPQEGDMHFVWAQEVVDKWLLGLAFPGISLIDMGCGEAFLQDMVAPAGISYLGVCVGVDYEHAKALGRNVIYADFTFSSIKSSSYDIVFSRHSLEHSPLPLLTLMEWHRIARKFLVLVLPNPEYWKYGGQNHYSVLHQDQWDFLLSRSRWEVIETDHNEIEYRYLCRKDEK